MKRLKKWQRRLRRRLFIIRIKRYIKESKLLSWDRRQVALAVALGLFVVFWPIPLQVLYAGFLASLLRVNVPITIAVTTINNPFTFLPINYFVYKVGTWITGDHAGMINFPSWKWDLHHFGHFSTEIQKWLVVAGKSYGIGLLMVSVVTAILGYLTVELVWWLVETYKKRGKT